MAVPDSSPSNDATAHHHPQFVLASVVTTSGIFPRQGGMHVRPDQTVESFLNIAAKELHLTDTAGWVVNIDDRDIDPARSFQEDGLTGAVKLHWGPREGGGG